MRPCPNGELWCRESPDVHRTSARTCMTCRADEGTEEEIARDESL